MVDYSPYINSPPPLISPVLTLPGSVVRSLWQTAGASSDCRSKQTFYHTGRSGTVFPRCELSGASSGSQPLRSVSHRCHNGKVSPLCGLSHGPPDWTDQRKPCRRLDIYNSSCGDHWVPCWKLGFCCGEPGGWLDVVKQWPHQCLPILLRSEEPQWSSLSYWLN